MTKDLHNGNWISEGSCNSDSQVSKHFERREPVDKRPSKTLYVAGLPVDFSYRELYNLFRFRPGFVKAVLNNQLGPRPIAWVRFDSVETASNTLEALHGLRVDPNLNIKLSLEFSPATGLLRNRITKPEIVTFPGISGAYVQVSERILKSSRDNARSETNVLYIGNVGNCEASVIRDVVAGFEGFCDFEWKVTNTNSCFAYVVFDCKDDATVALQNLHGIHFDNGLEDGIRVQYARRYNRSQ